MSWLDDQPSASGDADADQTGDQEDNGTPIPFLDPEIAAELEEDEIPEWFGLRWRDIDLEHQRQAWVWLRRWVDWFTDTYRLRSTVLPACWFQHPVMVEELYAAMCLEYKVWASQEPNVAAVTMWHNSVPAIADRLSSFTTEAQCGAEKGHVEAPRLVREVDEFAWEATLARRTVRTTLDHPREGLRGVRAVLSDHQGREVARSTPVGLTAREDHGEPKISAKWGAAGGHDDEELHLVIDNAHRVASVAWQVSDDDGGTWHGWDDDSGAGTTTYAAHNESGANS